MKPGEQHSNTLWQQNNNVIKNLMQMQQINNVGNRTIIIDTNTVILLSRSQ
jgi:hypothetical protein